MCERSHFQNYKCSIQFGVEYLELWCPACAAEFEHWLDAQAAEAEALDRQCGRGWLWVELARPTVN